MYRLKILLETGLVKGLVGMAVIFLLARNFVLPWASNHLEWVELPSQEAKEDAEDWLDAEDWFDRGLNHYNQGDYKSAIADYTKAIEIDPDYAK